jgi:hypothetical protein
MTRFREPTLIDLLKDPIIELVMRADGVTKDDIRELYAREDDIAAKRSPAFICSGLLKSGFQPEA